MSLFFNSSFTTLLHSDHQRLGAMATIRLSVQSCYSTIHRVCITIQAHTHMHTHTHTHTFKLTLRLSFLVSLCLPPPLLMGSRFPLVFACDLFPRQDPSPLMAGTGGAISENKKQHKTEISLIYCFEGSISNPQGELRVLIWQKEWAKGKSWGMFWY